MTLHSQDLREQTKAQFKIIRRNARDYIVEWRDPTADEAIANIIHSRNEQQ